MKASKSQSSEGESEKKLEATSTKEPAKTTSQPTLEESSEYETETDEEGIFGKLWLTTVRLRGL